MKVGRTQIRRYRDSPNVFSQELFEGLPFRYNYLAAVLSFGQDRRWRSAMVDRVVGSQPQLILDVACGPGAVTRRLARMTSAHIIGLDLSATMLAQGQRDMAHSFLDDRVSLVRARAEELPFGDATFDALTFTYLLRYVSDPAETLRDMARVVKPGGPISSLEFAVPSQRWWHIAWWIYTRVLLPVGGLVLGGRHWFDAGRFLGPSISQHYQQYSLEWTREAWHRAGIDHVEFRTMSRGGGVIISGYRRDK
ncbi:MAG: class I SAM-dependent methyltransferase [Acidimicrobiaceae bacterium]|nr:class I SAM-dependent methyltransferase [Acidimicrobiaceae bacterium]